MSDYAEPNCSRSCRVALCNDKPRHVRRLNFGQSILELDAIEQCFTSNRTVVIDQNVAHIPCTKKEDYVRKWIETHKDGECYVIPSDLSQSSPVLGTSATKASEKSPILSNSRKRSRGKIRINRHITAKNMSNVDCQENAGFSRNYTLQSKIDRRSKRKNKYKKCLSTCISPYIEKDADETSPVLGAYYNFKKRRKKLQYESGSSIYSKHLKLYDNKIINTDIDTAELNNKCSIVRDIPMDDKLEENMNIIITTTSSSNEIKKSPEICQKHSEMFFSLTQERLSFQDSSSNTDKDNFKIEIGISDNSKEKEILSTHSNSNSNLSNFIEDTDTQETMKIFQSSKSEKSLIPSRQLFTSSQLVTDNLDETYCSKAEIVNNQNIHLSVNISQIPSLNKTTQKTGSTSTQTDAIISTITTPSKKSPDKNMYAHLLDSGKKRRKPKKGSLVAKLQSLVNAQISDIRIWRHQMKKEQDASVQFISVLVHSCTKQFGNQFLDGILIEDSFTLLHNNVEIEEAKSHNTEVPPKKFLYKKITIMLVCDIVGRLKMISDVVINVYPPWNILDKNNLTLEATYISINNNRNIPIIANKNNLHKHKKRVVKEFNCPCIEEQRELPFCAGKPNSNKPDVMQRIFDF